jgi:dihydroneopterin aldolase / 2-amino-4-hydroxy-6-hydroxymethyldihydropteridine diphosphokinase / dihydropteroate synthase
MQTIGASSFLTLEALADNAASEVLQCIRSQHPGCKSAVVTLRAAKPAALVFASSAEVEVRRTFEDERHAIPDILSDFGNVAGSVLGGTETVAIALGSNLGDRFYNIELALRLLEAPKELLSPGDVKECGIDIFATIIDTSFLYETAPMYVTDQPSFINCACLVRPSDYSVLLYLMFKQIETNLRPVILLRLLKNVESAVGRVSSIRNGPRAVDLDIVLYGDAVIDTRPLSQRSNLDNLMGELVVPHPRMVEREFVLRPLNECVFLIHMNNENTYCHVRSIIPDFVHPTYKKALHTLLSDLSEKDSFMRQVIPIPRYPLPSNYPWSYPWVSPVPPTLSHWIYPINPKPTRRSGNKRKTLLMATLNMTPDSFSDGSVNNTLQAGLAYAQNALKADASIIDIGGYSTRPGAVFVSVQEETERVVPIIAAIRSVGLRVGIQSDDEGESSVDQERQLRRLPLSVDTFRPEVAKAAIIAGANCINDVYAFTGRDSYPYVEEDEMAEACMDRMKNVAREFAVPVILMHSRGDAGQNKDYGMYSYAEHGGGAVLEGVRVELGGKVERIVKGKGGVRRWMIVVDPGIGFSKTLEGNLELLRDAADVVAPVEGKGRSILFLFDMAFFDRDRVFCSRHHQKEPSHRVSLPYRRF